MVEARLTDGYRIGELLASEIDGRRSGPLAALAVANADRTVEGTPTGERAYDVRRLDDATDSDRDPRREPTPEDDGDLFARAFVHETGATLVIEGVGEGAIDAARATAEEAGLEIDPEWDAGGLAVRLAYGAQAKRALDVLESAVDRTA
ncbi:hypothetical protein GCM10028857_02790 [Salinarchaeum chitinilyticum]